MNHSIYGMRPLEEVFFREEGERNTNDQRQLLAIQEHLRKERESREALSQVSGITDPAILDHLVDLGVRPETFAAVCAVPLIEVVWADGRVDEEERKAVRKFATEHGMPEGSIERELLECWLVQRPPERLLTVWQHHVEVLCSRMTPDERETLEKELLRNAEAGAEASGGLRVGRERRIGAICKKERAVLDKLRDAFRQVARRPA